MINILLINILKHTTDFISMMHIIVLVFKMIIISSSIVMSFSFQLSAFTLSLSSFAFGILTVTLMIAFTL